MPPMPTETIATPAASRRLHTLPTALVAVVSFWLVLAEPAFAQAAGSNVEGFLQNIVDLLTGRIARLLAIIAVVLLGLSVLFGALDMRRAGSTILGIIIPFSAAWIVGQITG